MHCSVRLNPLYQLLNLKFDRNHRNLSKQLQRWTNTLFCNKSLSIRVSFAQQTVVKNLNFVHVEWDLFRTGYRKRILEHWIGLSTALLLFSIKASGRVNVAINIRLRFASKWIPREEVRFQSLRLAIICIQRQQFLFCRFEATHKKTL